ncbi:AbrB family transcriptional regulator [Roseococcus sp. SDR]|uniref:AbrB family transcriptional regulator n=1 Tax=Roseococcus sp. SDR TaxID=2835532 RepID=UPI001BD13B0E|nr:AbrB family transcriptional regulator [Roseococcus sp. SDR]MBV1847944.1 AbrB family transcriptional regulator [Roseococcus sp. SDR]
MTLPPSLPAHLLTLAAAVAGGFIFSLLHVPLAWMIGAMFGTAAVAWFRPFDLVPAVHPAARPAALIVIGLAFGQTFSGPVLAALLGAAPAILIAGVLSILAGIATMPVFTRMAGTDARTAYFATIPGGVIVMAVLADRAGAPLAPVTLAQTLRVLVVVLVMPPTLSAIAPHGDSSAFVAPRLVFDATGFLGMLVVGSVGALLLRRTGIANPWMIGPCFLAITAAAFGHLPSAVPPLLIDAAQVGMGAGLGQKLTREFLLGARKLMRAALVSSLLLCLFCTVFGAGLAWIMGLPPSAVMLGMAPGGMPEMGVTAKALGVAVPLVLAFHLTRTLMCNFLLGPIYRGLVGLGLFRPHGSA